MLLRSVLFLFACTVQANPSIIWLQTDWPPHQIVSGPFQGQGTFDLLQQQIVGLLPQFNHQAQLVSLPRLEQAITDADATRCTLGTLYSEQRAKNRLFSKPAAVGPAIAIGYIAGTLTKHPAMQDKGVFIDRLAQDKALTGVYQPNRLYHETVSQVLQRTDSNLNSYFFSGEVNAVALLASGRVDYVLEYPERMQYYNRLLPEAAQLEHRAIVNADVASISYVTCTNDDAGHAVISAVNLVLPQLWQQTDYLEAMQYWLDDSARRRIGKDISQLQQQALMQLKPRPDNTIDAGNH